MLNKFITEELVTRVMPGGFLLAIIFFVFGNNTQLNLIDGLDFFYTFLFFCSAFIVGELLQTTAHELEFVIDVFFKCRRPSKVFLYKNNPVLKKNKHKRKEIIRKLKITKEEMKYFNKDYSKLPILWWKKNKAADDLSQSIFWKHYSQVSNTEEIKISNRNYLFSRVIMVEFLLVSILLFIDESMQLGVISNVIFLLFLWRSRGMARGLVFKTLLLSEKKKRL